MENLAVGKAAKNTRKTKEGIKRDLKHSILDGEKHENKELARKAS